MKQSAKDGLGYISPYRQKLKDEAAGPFSLKKLKAEKKIRAIHKKVLENDKAHKKANAIMLDSKFVNTWADSGSKK